MAQALAAVAPSSPSPATLPASQSGHLQHLQPPGLYDAAPNGYTHVVRVESPLRWVFVSGQGGENMAAELPDDFAAQARQALANVQTALHAAHADMADVAKLTVLIVDHSLERFHLWQQALRQYWGEAHQPPLPFPACTLIPVPKLALPGMLIEVEATAVRPL